MADDKPLWSYWLNLAEVPLEHAICLSLNFDPGILEETGDLYVRADRASVLNSFRAQFSVRLKTAQTHIDTLSLKARHEDGRFGDRHMVSLAEFRRWGESLPVPFNFPGEFPKPQAAPTNSSAELPAKIEPSPRNENANLRIIAAMLALLRDREGGRFPSDAKVIEVLVEKYGEADGISKRNLETVFPSAKRAAGDDLKPKTSHRK